MRFFIGIAGGSGSGKTSVSTHLQELHPRSQNGGIIALSQDSYYKTLEPGVDFSTVNWDHPSSIDFDLIIQHLQAIQRGETIQVPTYDFASSSRTEQWTTIEPPQNPIVILEGILVFAVPALVDLFDLKVFVDSPADIRILRRLNRDVLERGRSVEHITAQYMKSVRPMYIEFVAPTRSLADVIIPFGHNDNAVEMISALIEKKTSGTGSSFKKASDSKMREA